MKYNEEGLGDIRMNKEIRHIATSYDGNLFAVAEFEKMVYLCVLNGT